MGATRMICGACGDSNRPGRKFCANCGAALSVACPSCGAPNEPDDRFCGECGGSLQGAATAQSVQPAPADAAPHLPTSDSERRLVSVLFTDLVGFTPLSESRDAEEVRDLLSRYFEAARRIVERYGGTIEKFIGDAVMAVWGSPVAREDDAERAVRAGLDLVAAVDALGAEEGIDGLSARAGIATGEASVNRAAQNQGMVIGDLVNTAARVQSAAAASSVFVTDATKRASDAALAYEDAGAHALKGKAQPMHLHRALRVVAGRGGMSKATGLEAPFVGRDRELRLLKDLFHATAEGGSPHLVAVTGIGGIGKSRLAWEFEKYLDGLVDTVYWHRGRCIAYGEGISYWALAEMVRSRTGVAEEEAPAGTLEKLRAWLADWCEDVGERRWLETQLGQLLGLGDRDSASRDELFSGWRRFFELLTERGPVVLVFEDLQWGDGGLLDFIDELLARAGDRPLYVVALARPEIADRRPGWATGRTGWTSIALGPLRDQDMDQLLLGTVPGMPDTLVARIRERAEGVPLYAVETLRMLLDRGVLRRTEAGAEVAPGVETADLDVPETLQALIGARLDGLPGDERSLLQHASVLGKTFAPGALAALTGLSEEELGPLLDDMVRKELLTIVTDPLSPDRGQYGFLQSIVQRVAYDTVSRRDRKVRHLAVARHLETTWAGDEDEVAAVVAAHYLEAYESAPNDTDAGEVRAAARAALERAGRRAYALAAGEEAAGYFDRAAALSDDDLERTRLSEQAARGLYLATRLDETAVRYDAVIADYERLGRPLDAARVRARTGELYWSMDRIDDGIARMEAAYEALADERGEDAAALAGQLGRFRFFRSRTREDLLAALEPIEHALALADPLLYPGVLSDALNTKGLILGSLERGAEALALLEAALDIALEHDETVAAVRAYTNLSNELWQLDRPHAAHEFVQAGMALTERTGMMAHWWFLVQHLLSYLSTVGRWDEAAQWWARAQEHWDDPAVVQNRAMLCAIWIDVDGRGRGHLDALDELEAVVRPGETSEDVQTRSFVDAFLAVTANLRGAHADALVRGRRVLDAAEVLGIRHPVSKVANEEALEAAVVLGDLEAADAILGRLRAIPRGVATPVFGAIISTFTAMADARRPDSDPDAIDRAFRQGAAGYRDIDFVFKAARTQLWQAEWLASIGRADAATAVAAEAARVFRELRATPWLERAEALAPSAAGV